MDSELEEQIHSLVNQAISNLETKIIRVVVKYQKKVEKEHEKEIKAYSRGVDIPRPSSSSSKKSSKYKTSSQRDRTKHSSFGSSRYYSDSDDDYSD